VRIGVLTTSYPRDAEDAAGAFVAGFARWLAAHVGDVEVLHADERRPLFYRGGAPAALAGGGRWGEALAFSTRLLLAAARRARRWDAIVSHWLVPAGALGAALGRGRPHLCIAHGSDVRLLQRLPGGRELVRSLARRADLVYVAEALRIPGAPGRVVPMAIDVPAIAAATDDQARSAARRALGLDGFTALFLGRLIRDKGCDLLLDGLPAGATLLVAGDGPERAQLMQQAALSAGRVRFLGEVRGAAKLQLLAAADALVIPSRVDGAPTVALEGLAAGLPIVATRAGGLPELLRDHTTALFTDGIPSSLGAAIARLTEDRALAQRLSSHARAAAPAHDWSTVGPRLAGALASGTMRDGCVSCIAL
jgi:glycosyltransferase involved in cell wall biosynthesis